MAGLAHAPMLALNLNPLPTAPTSDEKTDRASMSGRSRLPRIVFTLGWISFFTDLATEMVYPILPMFLLTLTGGSAATLGLIEGIADALVSVMRAIAGWRSDVIRRRVPFIRLGYFLGMIGKPILAIAPHWGVVLMGRSIDRIGKGIRSSARDAYLADEVGRESRGRAFGVQRVMDTSGALLGGAAALLLLRLLPEQYRTIFAIATIPGLCAVAITFLIPESSKIPVRSVGASELDIKATEIEPVQPGEIDGTAEGWKGLRVTAWPAAYWRSLILLIIFGLAASSDAFLFLRAADIGVSASLVPLGYMLYNLVYAACAYPAGLLSDRIGRWNVIRIGWIVYAIVYAGFGAISATNEHLIWPLFAVYGLFAAFTEGVTKALLADHAPPDQRGSAIGFASMCLGLTTLAASLIAGWLWDAYGAASPFWFGSFVAAFAALVSPVLLPSKSNGSA